MIFMPVNSVETDFLFTQDSKSSFLLMRSVKEEEGREREERIRRIATYSSMT